MVLESEKSKSMMSATMKGLTAVSTAEYIIWGRGGGGENGFARSDLS